MKNRIIAMMAALAASAACAAPLDAYLSTYGNVSIGDALLVMQIHHQNWNGKTDGGRNDYTYPDAATGSLPVEFWNGGKKCADGRISLVETGDKRAVVNAYMRSAADQSPAATICTLTMPTPAYAGTAWKTSTGKSGVVMKDFDWKTQWVMGENVEWIELTPPGRDTIRFSFPCPTFVNIQDNRKWMQSVELRISPNAGSPGFKKDVVKLFSFVVSTSSKDGVAASVAQPVVIEEGEEWIALDYKKDIEAGSALDFSNQGLHDAPAGKYGWVTNVNGHFAFEQTPEKRQRFYGVNLGFTANFPDHAFADQLATRLARLGYNAVRIHHIDHPFKEGVNKETPDLVALNAERMDRLDYFVSKLYEKGIYVTTDLYTIRLVPWTAIGIQRGDFVPMNVFKNLVLVHEPAFENWKAFAKNLLTHVNPYTKRAYKDDPGMPFISLVNEGALTMCWWQIRNEEPMKKAWASWLAKRRAAEPGFAAGMDDPTKVDIWTAVGRQFMADIERDFVTRAKAFLRDELGVKAMVSNQNCGGQDPALAFVREDLYDYVDDHFYVDHPSFVKYEWSLPSFCANNNPVNSSWFPPGAIYSRMPTKPFTITEWNFAGPGMYRSVGGIMTGALGALQDWDGLWRFAYSESLDGMMDGKGVPNYFDVASDPLGQAGDRASVCLFLRGDLDPLKDGLALNITKDLVAPADGKNVGPSVPWGRDAVWLTRLATTVKGAYPGYTSYDLKDVRAAKTAPVELAANPAITLDHEKGTFRIVTPKTSGGFAPSGVLKAGDVSFNAGKTPTTVWASSLDGQPIKSSRRILVSHLTDVQANGNTFAERGRNTLLKWGTFPPVVRAGKALVVLALDKPADYTVWSLATNGKRLEKMPSEVKGGFLVFTADVKGPNGARMLYEVVAEEKPAAEEKGGESDPE